MMSSRESRNRNGRSVQKEKHEAKGREMLPAQCWAFATNVASDMAAIGLNGQQAEVCTRTTLSALDCAIDVVEVLPRYRVERNVLRRAYFCVADVRLSFLLWFFIFTTQISPDALIEIKLPGSLTPILQG